MSGHHRNDCPYIVVLGTWAIDTKGRTRRPHRPRMPSPDNIHIRVGEVVRNLALAEDLVCLSMSTVLLTAMGDDEFRVREKVAQSQMQVRT